MHLCSLKDGDGFADRTTSWAKKLKRSFQQWILISPSSPLCAKFFRSETAIRAEKERQLKSCCPWVVHPLSKFRAWYQVVLVLIHLTNLFGKPIDAAFANGRSPLYGGHREISLILDSLCWVDICMNFMTGYVVTTFRRIEMEPKQIAKNYMKSPYFVCDVLSGIPRNLIYYLLERPPKIFLGVLNIFCVLKLIRIVTVVSLIYRISQYFEFNKSKGLVFLFCSLCVTSIMVHWLACLQFIVPRLIGRYFRYNPKEDSWIYQDGLYNEPMGIKYLHSFFKTSAEILGMRLSMYKMGPTEDYIVAIVTYVVGKILIVSIWIILAIAILNARSMEIKFEEIVNQLDEYMKQKQLPFNLRDRISQYYNFKYQKKYFKEEMIGELLSSSLKKEVNLHVCKSLISNVSLFADLTPDQLSLLVAKLIPEIFLPRDTILQSGAPSESMYFLSSGTVAVYTHSGKEVCHLQDGDYFGEICLVLKNQLALTSIVAIEITQVYRLKKKDFERVLMKNKVVFNKIVLEAEARLKSILLMEETYKRELFEKTFRKSEDKLSVHFDAD
ncbi:unnamed protein product [Phaedon cochleariae]|uniref:Cyclic nucleotide-binding domain-containing protein n=1 Tax=Phaedon cochleariae TaxID=80249 RepID=A0A9N9SME0_PHACE|nr:unnamed protein product [Phaedon cochleariae]